jgi:hypothetical protein
MKNEDYCTKTTKEFTLESFGSMTHVSDPTAPFLSDMNPDDIPSFDKFKIPGSG